MARLPRLRPPPRSWLITGGAILLFLVALPWIVTPIVGGRLRAAAAERGFETRWRKLAWHWPMGVEVRGLELDRRESRSPVLRAEALELTLVPRWTSLRPRVTKLALDRARVLLPAASEDEPERAPEEPRGGPASPRVRAAATQLADVLLLPARRLPAVRLTDLELVRGDSLFARLEALTLTHREGGTQLAAVGLLARDAPVPFDLAFDWRRDDRLSGRASFDLGGPVRAVSRFSVMVEGRLSQDRRAGIVRIADDSRLRVGQFELALSGEVHRQGPRFQLAVEARGLTADGIQESLPPAMLGPLADLSVRGSWDWRASLDVDVSAPDSTRVMADVVPHGLALGPDGARLPLHRLATPFLATIHAPRGPVFRELAPESPSFRPLERVSPLLREALLTNEDGGFYRHHGFNTSAIQGAIAENLRTGAFRRGAGTITMQLARNLYLGHRRTLSRKGQEVVLAWVLENLTGLSKDRLFEIYLNVIEWGPGLHGAAEAARFYFDKDPAEVTLDEALFLTVLVPSPSRWRSRVDPAGALRPWAREQMAFIARKMRARGVLDSTAVPGADSLRVELRGEAARELVERERAIRERSGARRGEPGARPASPAADTTTAMP
jgi:hypothetical protein